MADGTKAVVDTSVADEAALATALDGLPDDGSEASSGTGTPGATDERPGEPADDTGKNGTVKDDTAKSGKPKSASPAAAADGAPAARTTGAKPAAGRKPGGGKPAGARKTPVAKPAAAAKPGGKPSAAAQSTKATKAAEPVEPTEPTEPVEAVEPAEPAEAPEPIEQVEQAEQAEAAEQVEESTAPLSAAEIAAELTAGKAAKAAAAAAATKGAAAGRAGQKTARSRATGSGLSTETLDADTATLPALLPAPQRHSGDKIGDRYRLEECISQSDSFSSWRAVDEKLRRAVGVHLLAAGHQRAKAVLTAARSAALLNDPRFVQVLDAVQEGDLVYVVREWLPGASDLGRLLAAGAMEPYDAYQMVRQVTDAISAAHRRGQAHLRLTPTCVLRTDGGQYRINGIAVDAALRGLPTEDAELTDVRAIGALLYAALTHRWPYPEDRYDLQGLPKDLGCVPPDQVKAGVHKGLSELAARILCENPPHQKEPITSPEQLAKAIALMPKIRQPEPPAPPTLRPLPAAAPPRYAAGRPTQVLPEVEDLPPAPVPRPRPRRRALKAAAKWTASLVALAAIAVASWQAVDRLHHTDRTPTTGEHTAAAPAPSSSPKPTLTGAKIVPAALAPFNAFGETKDEHVPDLPKATDGNPATAWTTQRYDDPFGSGGYRAGTGLLIDLGSAKSVGSVDIQFLGDHKVELKAAPADTAAAPGADEAGFRAFGASVASGSGSKVTLKPESPVTARYLLVWLTGIPADSEGGYKGKVAEIQVNG
ncbi:protein kinase family protein [Kitasatospora cinereorecta]|uniref:Protein kinase family protein n=1 Tax=Kitasatospora cinereorecta TaxID=285560 RepID=A0ABW0VHA5_9ACTN